MRLPLVPRSRLPFFSSFSRSFSAAAAAASEFDLIVIGGGPGGYVAAIKAAQMGLKTGCIEKRNALGGTCLNVGCIPSKALLNFSHKYREAVDDFEKYGIKAEKVEIDLNKMQQAKNKIVQGLTQGIAGLFKKNKVTHIQRGYSRKIKLPIPSGIIQIQYSLQGEGRLLGNGYVEVTKENKSTEKFKTKNIILATGSEPSPFPGNAIEADEERILTSTGALSLSFIPKHLVVIGGGVIGIEIGTVCKNLGSQVTVVEYSNQIIPSMDGEVGKAFQKILEKKGIKFIFETQVINSKKENDQVQIQLSKVKTGETFDVCCDAVLLAVGRRPYTRGLGLEELNIETDKRGRILVNEKLQVLNHQNIMAIGDLIEGPMLAHKAEEEGIACVEILTGKEISKNIINIPSVVYTHPELAGVGKTEEQLKAEGIPYKRGAFPFLANSRARATGDTDGFVKVLACKETDKILGVWILGPNAGELIAEAVLAMEYGAASEDIARVCHAHPTLSEALKEACMASFDKPLHIA